MDFNDLIKTLIEKKDKIPKLKAIFIDEAQDLISITMEVS